MTKPQLRVVRPGDPEHWDLPMVYSGGKFSNITHTRKSMGDRPREVKPGEQLPDHWRRKSGAELFELERQARWATIGLEMRAFRQLVAERLEEGCRPRQAVREAADALDLGVLGISTARLMRELRHGSAAVDLDAVPAAPRERVELKLVELPKK